MKASYPMAPQPLETQRTPPSPRWLTVSAIVIGCSLALTLLRYAIDVLAVVAFVWVLGRTVGRIADFFAGEGDSGWSLAGIVPISLAAMLLLEMLGGPRLLTPHLERHLPTAVSRTIYWAKTNGWGQVMLPLEPAHEPVMAESRPNRQRVTLPPPTGEPWSVPTLSRAGRGETDVEVEAKAEAGDVDASETPVKTAITLETPGRVLPGTVVRLTATVVARSGEVPQGDVEFRSGRTLLGTVTLDHEGRASLGVRRLPVGTHEITATFKGTPPFADSMSIAVQQVVSRE
jgi:hypothetical protein